MLFRDGEPPGGGGWSAGLSRVGVAGCTAPTTLLVSPVEPRATSPEPRGRGRLCEGLHPHSPAPRLPRPRPAAPA